MPVLGVLAGGGALPRRLIDACRRSGREIFVVAFEGQTEPATVAGVPHVWVKLGAAGKTIQALHDADVSDLVMAGGIRRPSFSELAGDWRAAQLLARVGARAIGDDGLLKAVRDELEQEGFRLVGADELLHELLAGEGPIGTLQPDATQLADIAHGFEIARTLGLLDIGQAVVVQQGLVLGVEAIEGTDALLQRCGTLKREGSGPVLVKRAKPQQDRRLDLPTIGVDTVTAAAAAGFAGIAVEAGGSLLLDRDALAAAADAAGLFVIGLRPDEPAAG